jgi:hypothetical protein
VSVVDVKTIQLFDLQQATFEHFETTQTPHFESEAITSMDQPLLHRFGVFRLSSLQQAGCSACCSFSASPICSFSAIEQKIAARQEETLFLSHSGFVSSFQPPHRSWAAQDN